MGINSPYIGVIGMINVVPIPEKVTYKGGIVARKSNVIRLIEKSSALGDEGYIMRAEPESITLIAQTDKGIFRAEQTLKQLMEAPAIQCMEIVDRPRFEYRGFMLDSARHMQSLDEIKKLIDAAALLKFNTMHWHLCDDQGYRIESKKFPLLNEKGSWRDGDNFGPIKSDKRYGGYYTQDEIREIVTYCKDRFIDVVPEIDLPGHTTALISSYPELSCLKKQIPVEKRQGIFEDVLCIGDENTLQFVFELLDEIILLFPYERFHIGGDEVKYNRWEACPKCSTKKQELGFENFAQLQWHFTKQIIEHLEKHGKKATVWNESLAGGKLTDEATVQMWLDPKKHSVRHANRGGKVITSDFYHYYCDYPYHMTPLKKAYKFNPVLKGIAPVMQKHVIGVEAPLWTEYVCDFEKLCYMFFPRIAAVAEVGWSKEENLDSTEFEKRFRKITPLLKSMGINPAKPEEWNPTPIQRLTGTVKFFSDKISIDILKSSLSNSKK